MAPLGSGYVWLAHDEKPPDFLLYHESHLVPPQFESCVLRGKMAFYTLLWAPNILQGTEHKALPHILAGMIPVIILWVGPVVLLSLSVSWCQFWVGPSLAHSARAHETEGQVSRLWYRTLWVLLSKRDPSSLPEDVHFPVTHWSHGSHDRVPQGPALLVIVWVGSGGLD